MIPRKQSELTKSRNLMLRVFFEDERNKWTMNKFAPRILVSRIVMQLTSGVVFENLTVYGLGGVKQYVKTFPDAFIDFFNIWGTLKGIMRIKSGTETKILQDFNGIVKPGEVCIN